MKVAIMQPYFFPYFGYFELIKSVDKFVIYDDVNYIKKGWINRNRILISGEPKMFTMPLVNASQNRRINEILLSPQISLWKTKFLKTIELNYKRAPHFDETYALVSKIIDYKAESLSEFITNSIVNVAKHLDINSEFVISSSSYNNSQLKGQDRIIDICKKECASVYINAVGGRELYTRDVFLNNNVELRFMENKSLGYEQFSNEFVSNLSIIDVLMFNGKTYL
ncbi:MULTISPECIES: WbqC family protein [unclassified Vibrio]|uniref:WbqC family protein n=1 Tax=unclassified Vibrio TaxID=2614977 RepID=UPI00354BE434